MSYKQLETTANEICETKKWIITNGGREWKMIADFYINKDGSKSKPFFRIWELSDGDASVTIEDGILSEKKPETGVNWPAMGTKTLAETLDFKRDLGTAVQTATEAQFIIDQEWAR